MSGGGASAINTGTVGGIHTGFSQTEMPKEKGDFTGMKASQTKAVDNESKSSSMVSLGSLSEVYKFEEQGTVKAWFKKNFPGTYKMFGSVDGFKEKCQSAWNSLCSFGSSMLQGLREAAGPVAAKFDAAENDQPIELKSAKDESALVAKLHENLSRQAEIQERLDRIQAARDKAYEAYEGFKDAYINGSKSNAQGSEGSSVVAKHVNDDQIEPEGSETFAVPLNGELNDEDALYIAQEYSKQEMKKFEAMEGKSPRPGDDENFTGDLVNGLSEEKNMLGSILNEMAFENDNLANADKEFGLYGLTVEEIAEMDPEDIDAAKKLWDLKQI